MKLLWTVLGLGLILSSCGSENALWIETRENNHHNVTLAMTQGIARQLLESKETDFGFSKKNDDHGITREGLLAVLNGQQRRLTTGEEEGSGTTAYMKQLPTPGGKGNDKLVLEIYKAGKQVFRLAVPDLEIAQVAEKSDEFVETSFGWKALLPFLAKTGGAVFVKDESDNTEVWVYVE